MVGREEAIFLFDLFILTAKLFNSYFAAVITWQRLMNSIVIEFTLIVVK